MTNIFYGYNPDITIIFTIDQSYNYLSQKNKVSYGLKSIVDSIDQSKSSKELDS